MVISFGSVKMQEKRASSTLKLWQNIIWESEREKEGCAQESTNETKNRILKAAGNLIKAEIREQIDINEYDPSIDDIAAKKLNPK